MKNVPSNWFWFGFIAILFINNTFLPNTMILLDIYLIKHSANYF